MGFLSLETNQLTPLIVQLFATADKRNIGKPSTEGRAQPRWNMNDGIFIPSRDLDYSYLSESGADSEKPHDFNEI